MPASPATVPPSVLVLLATYNGMPWLPEQLDSILSQSGVSVRIVALDDGSQDGTHQWLEGRARTERRLTVLPTRENSGSSARNFYRLIALADPAAADLVAFADQDDIWLPGKLARHAALLTEGGYDGVSSSVTSFSPSGTRTLVRKDYPQRELDFLLESPGPGSTFLLTPRLLRFVAETLAVSDSARNVEFHDSLIYAITRAHGWTWLIDGHPSVDYRQHGRNVIGSNVGPRSALTRLRLIRTRWLRNHATNLCRVSESVAPPGSGNKFEEMEALFTSRTFRSRLRLARAAQKLRRRPRDQAIIALLAILGIW